MKRYALAIGLLLAGFSFDATAFAAETCTSDGRCQVDVAGTKCGDGSPSFVNVIDRRNADELFIFAKGGGACWDAFTCGCALRGGTCYGITSPALSRPTSADATAAWSTDATSPVGGYNVVEIPYCTGDVGTGTRTTNYGTARNPATVQHVGHTNMALSIQYAKARFPNAKHVVVLGQSAGALSVEFNLRLVAQAFPNAKIDIIADSGVPFRTPYVSADSLRMIYQSWGTLANLPPGITAGADGVVDFSDLIAYNTRTFPKVKFALTAAYNDIVMGTFVGLLGNPAQGAVQGILTTTLNDTLTNKPNAKVYYVNGLTHVLTYFPEQFTSTEGWQLNDWFEAMLSDSPSWTNVVTPPQ